MLTQGSDFRIISHPMGVYAAPTSPAAASAFLALNMQLAVRSDYITDDTVQAARAHFGEPYDLLQVAKAADVLARNLAPGRPTAPLVARNWIVMAGALALLLWFGRRR